MIKVFTLAAALLVLTGCATQYQPFSPFSRGGYQDRRVASDQYRVSYYGNRTTSVARLKEMALYRCAEVTLKAGYDYFEVLGSGTKFPQYPNSGFVTVNYSIRMRKGKPVSPGPNIYVARDVRLTPG